MNTPRLGEDDRYGLPARAEAATRANRPSHLVALAGMVLFLAVVVALFAWRADAGAAKQLRRVSTDLDMLRARADHLAALRDELAAAPTDDRYRPIPDVLSRMSNIATEAGLASVPVPTAGANTFQESRRLTYRYTNVRAESLAPVIAWANLATERVPGMHVTAVKVVPQPNAWQVELNFARFERLD